MRPLPKIAPNPHDTRLTRSVSGQNERGEPVSLPVVTERPLTLYLNDQEIVTAMTIGDYPEYLALGYLRNQNILHDEDIVSAIEYDDALGVVVVRTPSASSDEASAEDSEGPVARAAGRRIRTSGCAEGTMFESFMESLAEVRLTSTQRLPTSQMYAVLSAVQAIPSLYLAAGAIHGCVLAEGDRPLLFFEDVGRHNAVDKIAGYMAHHGLRGGDKWLYTTGRLTSEMTLKSVQMEVPIVVSRSGFTAAGVELANRANLTLVGRARGHRFTVLSAPERLVRDIAPRSGGRSGSKSAKGEGA